MSIKFRPEGRNKKYVMQSFRRGGRQGSYITSFREHNEWNHIARNEPLNQKVIGRMFGHAHYLTSHAPEPVFIRHKAMRHYWNRKLDRKASVQYCNTRTLHRFL